MVPTSPKEVSPMIDEDLYVSTREQAASMAGVRPARIDYWVDTGLIQPTTDRHLTPHRRVMLFSFQELLSILVAAQLRDRGISLQHMRVVVSRLRERGYALPLAELRFATEGSEVYFMDENGQWEAGRKPAHALIDHRLDISALRARVHRSVGRAADSHGRIESRRGALGSKPLIAGTRVPVRTVQSYLDAGKRPEEILEAFPSLTQDDVAAVRQGA